MRAPAHNRLGSMFLRLETDRELRRRVVASKLMTPLLAPQAATAYGAMLDEIAEMVGMRRRIVEDEA